MSHTSSLAQFAPFAHAHRPALLSAVVVLAGCCSLPAPEHPARGPDVAAALQRLQDQAQTRRHPLSARAFRSGPDADPAEDTLAAAQLNHVSDALTDLAFDVFDVSVHLGACDPDLDFDPDGRTLRCELPSNTQPFSPSQIQTLLAQRFDPRGAGPWFTQLDPAARDEALLAGLDDLDRWEALLHDQCRRLEILDTTARLRAERTDSDLILTPTETDFARAAQLRAILTLQRVLNLTARWRAAPDALPHDPLPQLLVVRGHAIFQAHLHWLLDVILGDRAILAVWSRSWRHRSPLYTLLDDTLPHPGDPLASLPPGSIRSLLELRCDLGLALWFDDLDDLTPDLEPARFPQHPHRERLQRAWEAHAVTLDALAAHRVPFAYAWKELWDARLKNTFVAPAYNLVAAVSRFLGDTRLTHASPHLDATQLETLRALLQPGDIVLVQQHGYLSNAFLPGFWSHALLYLGPVSEWGALPLPDGTPLAQDPTARLLIERDLVDVTLEAISEGVVFSDLAHAVQKDAVLVLRPHADDTQRALALQRALRFHGVPYDFDFDFATDSRLVCTELVYRAWNPLVNFRVQIDAPHHDPPVPGILDVAGRLTMPAQEVARYVLYQHDHPDPEPEVDYPGHTLHLITLFDGQTLLDGPPALDALRETLDR